MQIACIKTTSVVLFVILLSGTGLAQKRELSEQEFEKIKTDAEDRSYKSNRHIVMESRHFDKGSAARPTLEIGEVSEGTADGHWRSLRIEKNKDGTKENETIIIGKAEYVRSSGGSWALKVDEEGNRFTVSGKWGEANLKETDFKFAYLGKVEVDGQNCSLYESKQYRNYQLRPGRNLAYTIIERLWIGADGKFIKRQTQTVESDGHLSIDTVWTYEYPARLKIEAPIN